MIRTLFRSFAESDREACLRLFDGNCPTHFAPGERADYQTFMSEKPGDYQVCLQDDEVVGAYGVLPEGPTGLALRWILVSNQRQGSGLGRAIMARVSVRLRTSGAGSRLYIGASHMSAPFFARFGATETGRIPNGWGPGMHRIDMELVA
ncbi:MAG: GNAT family N-acetyltransferase [Gemmatimonadota bacterium]